MAQERNPASELAAKRRQHTANCARCGAEFTGLLKKRYCSKGCGVMAWQAINREQVKASRKDRRARAAAQPQP